MLLDKFNPSKSKDKSAEMSLDKQYRQILEHRDKIVRKKTQSQVDFNISNINGTSSCVYHLNFLNFRFKS